MRPDTSNVCPRWASEPHFLKELPRVGPREDASSRHMPEWEFRKSGQNSILEYCLQKVIEIFVQKKLLLLIAHLPNLDFPRWEAVLQEGDRRLRKEVDTVDTGGSALYLLYFI